MLNGTSFALYIDNDKLLFSKSHSIEFNADAVDASYKIPEETIFGDSYYWESADLNWESADLKWDDSLGLSGVSGWKEIMMGFRSGNFSSEGLLLLDRDRQTWDTTDYYWELFNVDWEDGAIEPNPSITLDDLLISGEKVKFELITDSNYVVFSGNCRVNNYELVANNEGVMFYNADFSITGVTTQ
tara:strand:- start:1478 stop:2035 length:558 start_codon:yes stop_codon:yes gene_type:complete